MHARAHDTHDEVEVVVEQAEARAYSAEMLAKRVEKDLARARTSLVVSPHTGKPYRPQAGDVTKLTTKQEAAIRMLAVGQFKDNKSAAAYAGVSEQRFSILLNSTLGQSVVQRIRGDLDFRYQSLYTKFIDVIEQALDHADPSVALAGASLFAKTQLGTKHTTRVELSAEDVVSQIINGEYEVVG